MSLHGLMQDEPLLISSFIKYELFFFLSIVKERLKDNKFQVLRLKTLKILLKSSQRLWSKGI